MPEGTNPRASSPTTFQGLADRARPFWSLFTVWAARRMHCPRVLTRERALKGHKLISQTVALSRGLPLRWKAARFRFVIKRTGAERQGEGLRGHPMCLLRSRVRSPSSAGRALCRERPGRKRRWRNQRISLASGQERESPGGEALTTVYLLHRVSAGPMTARTRCLTGVLGEGIRFLR